MRAEKQRRDRVDGILLLDKPQGLTSNDALVRARRLLNAAKAGHGGTLDPMATGLLPLLFGEATKFAHDLLDADKRYWAQLTLGITTDTGDAQGGTIATHPVDVDERALRAAIAGFVGEIGQLPPMYSALKHQGRPYYEYARAGQTIERETRRVRIHSIDVTGFAAPVATFRVDCSKGTYIRTLAEDIGRALGCGAHLSALRREAVAGLSIGSAVSLETLEAESPVQRRARLGSVDALLGGLPQIELPDEEAARLLNGQRIRIDDDVADARRGHRVRVYGNGRLLGVATLIDGLLAPQRLIATQGADPAHLPARPVSEGIT
jgi:tRNA pseudouridine55 synthase